MTSTPARRRAILAHARVAVPNALFPAPPGYDTVPWATFTDPEVGAWG